MMSSQEIAAAVATEISQLTESEILEITRPAESVEEGKELVEIWLSLFWE